MPRQFPDGLRIHWKHGVLQAMAGESPDFERMTAEDWPEALGDQAAWEADVRTLHELYEERPSLDPCAPDPPMPRSP